MAKGEFSSIRAFSTPPQLKTNLELLKLTVAPFKLFSSMVSTFEPAESKFKSVKSSKPSKRKPVKKDLPPLKPVESATIEVGSKVKVQLGNSPMNAIITEIAGKDISVQLDSGMTIKTQMQNIYS